MRDPFTYRGARRMEAKRSKRIWRKLPRKRSTLKLNGKNRLGPIMVQV